MKKKLIVSDKIKKYLKKKNFMKHKKKIENNIGIISRTFLSSLIIISFFFITFIIIDFIKNTSLISVDFENNSKNSFKKLLEKKDIEFKVVSRKFFF